MGNLLLISLDDESDRINYFSALLAVGCTVRDIVRLGLCSKGLRSWVSTMVASLDLAPFRALVASLPASNRADFAKRFRDVSRFQTGCVCWESDPTQDRVPRLLELTLDLTNITMSYYSMNYCAILFNVSPVRTQGCYNYTRTQWYPMLDAAVKTATARFRIFELAAQHKEDAQAVHSMRVNLDNK